MSTPFLANATVKSRLAKLRRTQLQLRAVFDRENRKLDNQIADIQARCEHERVTVERAEAHYGHRRFQVDYVCGVCGYRSRQPIEPDPERAKEVVKLQSRPCAGGGLR